MKKGFEFGDMSIKFDHRVIAKKRTNHTGPQSHSNSNNVKELNVK